MFDEVPAQVWLLIGIGAASYAPARYVIEHCVHSPAYQDITQPPEDFGWRTPGKLALNLTILAALVALAIFIFTPAATHFARSAIFAPVIVGSLGAVSLGTAIRGFLAGHISPFVRGFNNTYQRETQPKRYWASLAWNAALGCMMLALAPAFYEDQRESQCDNSDHRHSPEEQLSACDQLLAQYAPGEELAELLKRRGIAYHKLGHYDRAATDYSRAIEIDPDDSYSLYNRGLARRRIGDVPGALQDFDASLRLRPDNEGGYFHRGLIFLDTGVFDRAVGDFTRAHALDEQDHWNLANRGIAYAWMGDRTRAEADFAAVAAVDPANVVVLRGRAILALQAGDQHSVIAHLTEVLEEHPLDGWSLAMRADTYWQMGLHNLARDDDERMDRLRKNFGAIGALERR